MPITSRSRGRAAVVINSRPSSFDARRCFCRRRRPHESLPRCSFVSGRVSIQVKSASYSDVDIKQQQQPRRRRHRQDVIGTRARVVPPYHLDPDSSDLCTFQWRVRANLYVSFFEIFLRYTVVDTEEEIISNSLRLIRFEDKSSFYHFTCRGFGE